MFINKFVNNSRKQGYALLVAILTMSLVTAVGFSILSISLKGFRLSVSERESVYAFYAADSGAECALLWDIRGIELNGIPTFATSTETGTGDTYPGWPNNAPSVVVANCFGENIISSWDINNPPRTGTETTTRFKLDFTEGYCAEVEVRKEVLIADPTRADTIIISRGYNSSCDDADQALSVTVERAIRVTY